MIRVIALYENIVSACITESGNDLGSRLYAKLCIFVCMYTSCCIIILVRIAVFNFADAVAVTVNMVCRTCSIFDFGSISLSS